MSEITRHYTFTGLASSRGQVSAQRFTRLASNYRTPDNTSNNHHLHHNVSQPQLHRPGGGVSLTNMCLRTRPSFFEKDWSKTFHSKKSSDSKSTKSKNTTDPELDARVAAIKAALRNLEPGIQAINNLIQIAHEYGHYCDFCSLERRKAGSCGSSCALLRPKGGDPGITAQIPETWERRSNKTKSHYLRIAREIRKAGDFPKPAAVSKWELDVADLREVLNSRYEKAVEDGLMPKEIKQVVGLDLDWTFEQAWKEKEDEVEVAPDELPQ